MKAIGNLSGYLIMDPDYHFFFADDVLIFVKASKSQA